MCIIARTALISVELKIDFVTAFRIHLSHNWVPSSIGMYNTQVINTNLECSLVAFQQLHFSIAESTLLKEKGGDDRSVKVAENDFLKF